MRILVISHMYPKAGSYSGIFVEQQVQELVKLGHEVTVVSPAAWAPFPLPYLSSKWKNYASVPKREKKNGYMVFFPRYVMFPHNFSAHTSGRRLWRNLRRQLDFSGAEFDLIHAHVALPDGYAAMKLAQEWQLPYVVTVHGTDFSTTINLNDKCYAVVEQALAKAEKVILVSSKLDKIRQARFAHLPEKFVVIPNGVAERFLQSPRQDSKVGLGGEGAGEYAEQCAEQYAGEYPEAREPIKLLSVSNLIALKGLDDNLRALAAVKESMPHFRYDIIGQGPERARLEALAGELGLVENVNFLGAKSASEVKEYMDACDVFSLPSWNEAFGVVYLEAMACGKPVIGCQGQGIEDVITHHKTGFLVKPKDVADLAATLLALFADPELREKVGAQARRLVQADFTWEKNAEKTIEIYKQILE